MYVLQWLNGTVWSNRYSGTNEQSALIQGMQISKADPGRKYRIILKEGGRQSVVHIF